MGANQPSFQRRRNAAVSSRISDIQHVRSLGAPARGVVAIT
jgi:hypothetical protein